MIKEFKISRSITERTPTLATYMQDISRYPLLTLDEEVELTQRAKAGDEIAKQQLIQSNLRFVISVAKSFVHQGTPLEDLIMEGNIGLMTAIDKFDPTRGFKLSTYAVWWIRQAILQSLAEKGRAVRMPLNQVGMLVRVRKATQAFLQRHERYPLPEELAELLDLPVDKVESAMNNAAVEYSLDAPIGEDGEITYEDTFESTLPATDSHLQHESLCTLIQQWLGVLKDDRARDIIQSYFGLNGTPPLTLEEIAAKHHITRERARQIHQHSLKIMGQHTPSALNS